MSRPGHCGLLLGMRNFEPWRGRTLRVAMASTVIALVAVSAWAGDSALQIPKAWDDSEMATLEIPLADPVGSPRHVSADYYYRIPVATIYKSYPIYVPGYEPPGYMDWLKQQEPEILWDDS